MPAMVVFPAPRKQDNGRRRGTKFDLGIRAAHELGHLFVHDLDDLLARRETFKHFCPNRTLRYGIHEAFHHREVYIRFEERQLHLAHSLFYVLLVELALAGKLFKYVLQFGRKPFKRHRLFLNHVVKFICFGVKRHFFFPFGQRAYQLFQLA